MNKQEIAHLFKKLLAKVVDCAGSALLRTRQNTPVNTNAIRKILLIRLDHIGDVLMTTPTVRALRKAYPDTEIHLLIKCPTHEVVALNPHIDRVMRLDAPWTITGPDRASWLEVAQIVTSLRKERYDCVVDFRPDLREALLTYATGAPYRIGYGERGGGFCFTHLIDFDPYQHEIHRAIDLLSPLEVTFDSDKMDFIFSPGDLEKADTILREAGIKTDRRIAGIHPGAASSFKRWTEEGFAALGDMLIENGYRVILLGGPGDKDLLQSITGRMRNSPPVICKINLKVLGALISQLDCLVCNDSAPSHIAQAVGTRTIVLYGPTHDKVTGPLDREKNQVARNPVPCAPCWLPGTRFHCPYNFRCWEELRVKDVLYKVMERYV